MKLACVIRSQLSPFLWDKRTRDILLKNFQYGTSQRWEKKPIFFCKQQQSVIQHTDSGRRPLPQIRSPPSRDRRHPHKFTSLRQTRDSPVNACSLLVSDVLSGLLETQGLSRSGGGSSVGRRVWEMLQSPEVLLSPGEPLLISSSGGPLGLTALGLMSSGLVLYSPFLV